MIDIRKFAEELPSWLKSREGKSITYQEKDTLKELLDYSELYSLDISKLQKRILEFCMARMSYDPDPEVAITNKSGEMDFMRISDMSDDEFSTYKENGFKQLNLAPTSTNRIAKISQLTDSNHKTIESRKSQKTGYMPLYPNMYERAHAELTSGEIFVWIEMVSRGYPLHGKSTDGTSYVVRISVETLIERTGISNKNIYTTIKGLTEKKWIRRIGKCDWEILVSPYCIEESN